jgi:hypothetical protein
MDVVLFVIGLVLVLRGRWSFMGFQTTGRHVKVAGALLMIPSAINVVIALILMLMYGPNPIVILEAANTFTLPILAVMVAVVILAYILIADPEGAPRLPGILGQIQDERRGIAPHEPQAPKPLDDNPPPKRPMPQQSRPQVRHPLDMGGSRAQSPRPGSYSTVLNVPDAARYMQVTEQQIMQWIDEGKLTAARGNHGFVIARSVLDELKSAPLS